MSDISIDHNNVSFTCYYYVIHITQRGNHYVDYYEVSSVIIIILSRITSLNRSENLFLKLHKEKVSKNCWRDRDYSRRKINCLNM